MVIIELFSCLAMKGVPGVMQLESKCDPLSFWGGKYAPFSSNSALSLSMVQIFSAVSLDALKRRDLCWFILARGATPSIAM